MVGIESLEWLEKYERNAVVYGFTIDAKDIENIYGLPMECISGRTNCERTRVFAMGFMEGKRECYISWLPQRLLRAIYTN